PARHRIGITISLAIAVIALFVLPNPLRAQQTDLSQQMQQFNSLPPDQQQAILQRLGQGGDTSSGIGGLSSGSLSGSAGGYNSSQSALIQQQMLQHRQQSQNESEQQFGPPVFKPGDTVLVDISLQGEMQNNGNPVNGQYNPQNARQSGYPNAAQTNGIIPTQLTPLQQQLLQQQLTQQQAANNQRLQEQPQQPIEELQADEKQRLTDLVDLIRSHNPYQLDSSGELQLPGIPAMALAGLTEDLATRRAAAEPAF